MKELGSIVYKKLQNLAKKENKSFQEVLLYYSMERFLARVVRSKHKERFILKGGLLIRVWDEELSRVTRDIDFLGKFRNDPASVKTIVQEICEVDAEDGVVFHPGSVKVESIIEGADYEGVRVTLSGKLSTARLPMQLDIGFGDTVIQSNFNRLRQRMKRT